MLSTTKAYTLCGIHGEKIDIEVDVSNGKPSVNVVGLPDATVKEAIERVTSAINNSGFVFPNKKVIINLAPADIKKEGAVFDLGIAIAILQANNYLALSQTKDYVFLGELSLDGNIRDVTGMLPLLISAKEAGETKFIIPMGNTGEASYVSDIEVFAVKSLKDVVDFLTGVTSINKVELKTWANLDSSLAEDFCRVKGQARAKRAMEIAVAGGHNIMMVGAPGSGKTMLARCVPTILPDLTFNEALEITKIHSVAGILDKNKGVVSSRPFRAPHHTASTISLTGGGRNSRPGEISLAHYGVLFLDEMPEYPRNLLETLRQPLEDGLITVARANQTIEYPASFMLVASMNPCPCGNYGCRGLECSCSPSQIDKYLKKLSGPLLDRIDLKIDVDRVEFMDLRTDTQEETSAEVKKRVDKARQIQLTRFINDGIFTNAKMTSKHIKKYCEIDSASEQLLKQAFERFHLSARGYTRILKVARTIADLDGSENIQKQHLIEAISYRNIEKYEL